MAFPAKRREYPIFGGERPKKKYQDLYIPSHSKQEPAALLPAKSGQLYFKIYETMAFPEGKVAAKRSIEGLHKFLANYNGPVNSDQYWKF